MYVSRDIRRAVEASGRSVRAAAAAHVPPRAPALQVNKMSINHNVVRRGGARLDRNLWTDHSILPVSPYASFSKLEGGWRAWALPALHSPRCAAPISVRGRGSAPSLAECRAGRGGGQAGRRAAKTSRLCVPRTRSAQQEAGHLRLHTHCTVIAFGSQPPPPPTLPMFAFIVVSFLLVIGVPVVFSNTRRVG